MEGYEPATYGDQIARIYDDLYSHMFDPEAQTTLLAELAGRGPALELGVGTGRVALPLSERGVEVHGIDTSEAMVAKLRAKQGGGGIPVTTADFADFDFDVTFSLVYVVFNTLFALRTQEEQVSCFAAVARHLRSGGRFLVEAFVPDPARFDRDQRTHVADVGLERVELEASRHDGARQEVVSQHVVLTQEGTFLYPVTIRYAWPSELDLMARLAGLALEGRWGGWHKEAFGSASSTHVTVYLKP